MKVKISLFLCLTILVSVFFPNESFARPGGGCVVVTHCDWGQACIDIMDCVRKPSWCHTHTDCGCCMGVDDEEPCYCQWVPWW